MSKKILVIGAGRSSSSLIKYLLDNAESQDWQVRIGDMNLELAEERVGGNSHGHAFKFNALDAAEREEEVRNSDFVISMLPARFHMEVVKDCIRFKKNLITPSYVSKELAALDQEVKDAGIIILNEIGLDPGIDHMSAQKIIDEIKNDGGKLSRFESFTGGLVAPESDNNPWNYKFTWNPRNVVLAGQGSAAQFLQGGKFKYVPYNSLFCRTKTIEIEGHGSFEGYPNRDSLKYIDVYGLEGIPTIYRGTLRKAGFPKAWNVFVQLGMTDDSYQMHNMADVTYREFTNSFLAYRTDISCEKKLQEYLNLDDEVLSKLRWVGIFSDEKIGLDSASPAVILQKLLETKWTLEEGDKDMIVMWHRFGYTIDGTEYDRTSSMVVIGDDEDYTAMAKTVGYPVGIACKMILNGKITAKGVKLPISANIYEPILDELEELGIVFTEKTSELA